MEVEIRYPTTQDNNGYPAVYKRLVEHHNSPATARKWAANAITNLLKQYPQAQGHIKIAAGTKPFDDAASINW